MQKLQNGKNKRNKIESDNNLLDLPKKNILGVNVTDAKQKDILEFIVDSLENLHKPYYIVTPNPEIIVLSTKNGEFKKVLNNAKIALNDGIGVSLAASVEGNSLVERFTGIELVEKVCEKANDWPITVGFLGGRDFVAEKAAECLKKKFPHLQIAFAQSEWDENWTKPIDILFVALGAPKQELWMSRHIGKIPVKVMAGIGGALDQIANPSLRPPKLMQGAGLGWLYRLIRQPWRWRRQMALVKFLGLVIKGKLWHSKEN